MPPYGYANQKKDCCHYKNRMAVNEDAYGSANLMHSPSPSAHHAPRVG